MQKFLSKLKIVHLYLLVLIIFLASFLYINTKYDRFYRVNGINNDNRVLIEKYLSEEEQEYLVENAIAVDKFIEYIKYDDFNLFYVNYYNLIKQTNAFSDKQELLATTNKIIKKINKTYNTNTYSYFKKLVNNNLFTIYLLSTDFDFANIEYYQTLRSEYSSTDTGWITSTNNYIKVLTSDNVSNLNSTLDRLSNYYDATGLNLLFTTTLPDSAKRVYQVTNTTVINSTTYIASYEPNDLKAVTGIPRSHYTMYLRENANTALQEMYAAMDTSLQKVLLLQSCYVSYNNLLAEGDSTTGYSELQLGNTISIKEKYKSVNDFSSSALYNWLINNAYKYGYILRYPAAKTTVTGHSFDATLFRYVGKKVAKKIQESSWSLEEYNEKQS